MACSLADLICLEGKNPNLTKKRLKNAYPKYVYTVLICGVPDTNVVPTQKQYYIRSSLCLLLRKQKEERTSHCAEGMLQYFEMIFDRILQFCKCFTMNCKFAFDLLKSVVFFVLGLGSNKLVSQGTRTASCDTFCSYGTNLNTNEISIYKCCCCHQTHMFKLAEFLQAK